MSEENTTGQAPAQDQGQTTGDAQQAAGSTTAPEGQEQEQLEDDEA